LLWWQGPRFRTMALSDGLFWWQGPRFRTMARMLRAHSGSIGAIGEVAAPFRQ
jgi:hypothetical protein